MMNTLYVFGDSWPAGSELDDVILDGFPNLIAQKNNYKLDNLSQNATSIDHATWQFLKAIERKPFNIGDIVLFCLTGLDRTWIWENGYPMELHPGNTNHIKGAPYYKYIHSDDLARANAVKNILLVNEMCLTRNVLCLFVYNWDKHIEHSLLNTIPFYNKTLHEIANNNFNPGGHPNKLGHQLIAEELSAWIKTHDN